MDQKTYRVTIKQPKGRAEFVVTLQASSRFDAMHDGIEFAKACGEVVRDSSTTVTEVSS